MHSRFGFNCAWKCYASNRWHPLYPFYKAVLQLIVLTYTLVLNLLDKRRHLVEDILIYAVAEPTL